MAWFEDLSSCTYFGRDAAPYLRAVGWLQNGQPFPTGPADPQMIARLVELAGQSWQPAKFFGSHRCDFCPPDDTVAGSRNLFIPGQGFVYVAPELILHYIEDHGYAPAAEFCRAVLDCPPPDSQEFFAAVRRTAPTAVWLVPDEHR